MNFKGTIVITDPCYIEGVDCPMERGTIYGDWSCMVYPGDINENKKHEEWDEHYFKFFNEYNFTGKTREEKDVMLAEHKKFREEWGKNILGEFCADAGKVGVFEWDKLGEDNQKWVTEHPWCAAIIKDFDGDVEFYVDGESVHVIGTTENHTNDFFSTQSGY